MLKFFCQGLFISPKCWKFAKSGHTDIHGRQLFDNFNSATDELLSFLFTEFLVLLLLWWRPRWQVLASQNKVPKSFWNIFGEKLIQLKLFWVRNVRSFVRLMMHFLQHLTTSFQIFLNGPTPVSFLFIFVLFKKTEFFTSNAMWKMSCPSSKGTAPGLDPTTSGTWVVCHNH